MPPDNAGAEVNAGEQTANREGTNVTENAAPETPAISKGILDRLGVPEELRKEIGLSQEPEEEPRPATAATDEAEPETVVAEEAAPEEEQPETEETPAVTADDQPHKDWPDHVKTEFSKRIGKLTRQRETEKTARETAEAERDDLKARLDAAQPVIVQPSQQDPLAAVESPEQLEQIRQEARLTIKWCRANRGGAIVADKDGTEKEISEARVEEMHNRAEDLLQEYLPKKERQLQDRGASDSIARELYPKLFEKGSLEYQVAQALMKELPSIAAHPARNLMLGDYLVGLGIRLNQEKQANGAPAATTERTVNNPDPLKRKIPPVAQHVARTSSAPRPSGKKQVDDAMNNVVAEGGTLGSVAAAIGAMRRNTAATPGKRSPVHV